MEPNEFYEAMASLEHSRWSHWMDYMFSCGTFNDDGTWTMPADKVDRWLRQAGTPYEELTEKEKDSDREQVNKTLTLMYENNYRFVDITEWISEDSENGDLN